MLYLHRYPFDAFVLDMGRISHQGVDGTNERLILGGGVYTDRVDVFDESFEHEKHVWPARYVGMDRDWEHTPIVFS
jgi:hypothetical protein